MSKNRKHLILSLAVCFLVTFAASCQKHKKTEPVPQDPYMLDWASKTQSYERLIKAAQDRTDSSKKLTFVVLGDSRSNWQAAQKVFAQAALESPACIFHVGDLVDKGTTDEFLSYFFPLVKEIAPVPVIPAPGNHDSGPLKDFHEFVSFFGGERFSFVLSNCRFVGINNSGADRLTAGDLDFLDRELGKPGPEHRFVFMHVPPAFVEVYGKEDSFKLKPRGFITNADQFRDLMARHRVREVFLGHDHGYASHVIDGVRYTITAGAGAELHGDMPWLQAFRHYLVLHVGDSEIKEEVVRLEGDKWVRTDVR